MRRGLLVLLLAAGPLAGVYTYYYGDSFATINTAEWQKNGTISASSTGLRTSDANGGALISLHAVPDGTASYEIRSDLNLATAGATYVHYLRASTDALSAPTGAAGSYVAIELQNPQWTVSGYQATLAISQRVGGVITILNTSQVGCKSAMVMQSIITDYGYVHVYLDGVLATPPVQVSSSLTSGKPGVGVRNAGANAAITHADLGPFDRVSPPAMTLSSVATWPMPTKVEMQWDGAPDDTNGSGVVMYQISRNGVVVAYTRGGFYSDDGILANSTAYTYTILAMDRHGNWSAPVSVPVTTLAANEGESRRLGVKSTGAYWGAAGENIDMFSGNLNFTLPLLNPMQRNGGQVPLSLHYNSQNWRSDSNGTWNMGRDIGYGYGWMLTAGYVRANYRNYWDIDHYTYVDSTGAEYRLDVQVNGVWRSKQGTYVGFNPSENKLILPNGVWYMLCASQGDEPDSGTLYPTHFYDHNGNYIVMGYAGGNGVNLANSSGRIIAIADIRTPSWASSSYSFSYSNEAIPHLTTIQNSIQTGEAYSFTYSQNQPLNSPFSPYAQFGTVDLLASVTITNLGVSHAFEYGANQAGELSKVTFPYGADVEWGYTSFTFGSGKTFREVSSRLLRTIPGGSQWVYGIAASDSGTPAFAHNARVVSDANGRDTRKYTFDVTAASPSYGAATGFEQRDTSLAAANQVLLQRDDVWTTDANGNVYLTGSTTTLDPGTANLKSKAEMDRDVYGNVVQQRIYDYSTGTPALKRTYRNTYAYSLPSANIYNLLTKSEIIEGATTVQTASYNYDTAPAGNCPAGSTNLTDAVDMKYHDGAYGTSMTSRGLITYASVLGKAPVCVSYNIGGTVLKTQATGGITVDYIVNSQTQYTMPSWVTPNSESNLASSAQYNSFLGLSSITGPNASTAAFTYDSMARPSTTTSPYGAVTTYGYTNRSGTTLGTSTATTNGKWARTTVDGLGRTVKAERGYGTTVVSIVDTVYAPCACSAVGKVQKVSQPYAPGGTVYWTQYEYDARGRTTKVTPPLNAGYTSYVYAGNTVKVIDPAGRYKIHTLDAIGNLKKVSEKNPAGGADLDTFYTYNLADKLTQVSMTRGTTTQLRIFTYDSAFRLETERHPETGLTTYTYDSQGRVSTKVDAKSQKVEYVYDAYGRVSMVKRYPVATGAEDLAQRTTNTYDYDEDPDGASSESRHLWGRLAAVKTGEYGWTERYSYTSSGLLAKKKTEFYPDNGYMKPTVDYMYDNEGKVTNMVYPLHGQMTGQYTYEMLPQLALSYTYNSMGQLQGVTGAGSATYNAAGQLTTLGGWSFEYNGRNQLTREAAGSTDIQYRYSTTANDGRLTQKRMWNIATNTGEEENYTYDSLGRLATAYSTGPEWGLSWVYDGFGNRTQQNVTKGTAPSSSQSVDPLTNRLNGSGITYDSNGNLTGWSTPTGSVTAAYDVENRMTTIQTPDTAESYKYGPGNLRAIKQMPYDRWYSVYGKDGELLGTYKRCAGGGGIAFLCEARERVYFGRRLVRFEGEPDSWQSVTLNQVGTPMDVHGRVYPYGETENGWLWADQEETFATYKRDRFAGLDYAMNRYYASAWGRFTTADPYRASGGPANPQSWNRYAYVEGDPINMVDPSGLAGTETGYGPPPGFTCNTFAGSTCSFFNGGAYSAATPSISVESNTISSYNPTVNYASINGQSVKVGGGSMIGFGGLELNDGVASYVNGVRWAWGSDVLGSSVIVRVAGWVAGDDPFAAQGRYNKIAAAVSDYNRGRLGDAGLNEQVRTDPYESRPLPSPASTVGWRNIPEAPSPVTIKPPVTYMPIETDRPYPIRPPWPVPIEPVPGTPPIPIRIPFFSKGGILD